MRLTLGNSHVISPTYLDLYCTLPTRQVFFGLLFIARKKKPLCDDHVRPSVHLWRGTSD